MFLRPKLQGQTNDSKMVMKRKQTTLYILEVLNRGGNVAWRNTPNKAGSGETRLGKVPKLNEVLRRGYKTRVSSERLGGILINISVCNVT